ncbi:MAG: glutamate racemase [Candidatus Omnitrophota bacterium]
MYLFKGEDELRKGLLPQAPVGIFDSGLGGLTVVKAVTKLLPAEDIVYFGDTARVPYGTKSPSAIIKFSRQNAKVLLAQGVKAIVIACNSSSSHALEILKKEVPVPVLGVIDPGVRKALSVTETGRVGIIATRATVNSHAYRDRFKKCRPGLVVFEQACPLLVPLVEEGWFSRQVTRDIAAQYLEMLRKKKIDALVLGCTHYPLLKKVLRAVMGDGVNLIDSAEEVAQDLKMLLKKENLLRSSSKRKARHLFLVSDEPKHFQRQAKRFLGRDVLKVKKLF